MIEEQEAVSGDADEENDEFSRLPIDRLYEKADESYLSGVVSS